MPGGALRLSGSASSTGGLVVSGSVAGRGGASASRSAGLGGSAGGRYDHATLSVEGSDDPPLRCQFNPTEYAITTSATWHRATAPGAPHVSAAQFVGTDAASLSVDLFFDARDDGAPPVGEAVTRLLSWTEPTRRSVDDQLPTPPVVTFEWGGTASFRAFVSSVTARFVLFRRDGSPIRAHVSLRLEQVPTLLPGTNPTSGSDVVVRQRTLGAGETLALLAWQEYGRAEDWRLIAEASGIDDPRRLVPGTSVVVPERSSPGRRR